MYFPTTLIVTKSTPDKNQRTSVNSSSGNYEISINNKMIEQKASKGKKTLHALMNFFNERASIEAKYGESLMKLGRSGGAVKLGSVGK